LDAVHNGDVADKVAIVTGGNRGVGRVIARRFLEEGASVVTCSRGAYEQPPAAEGVEDAAGRSVHVPCDVRETEQIDDVVTRAVDVFGRVDVLINNAGGSPVADAGSASPRFHKAIIEINLTGPLWFAQRVNAVMQGQPDGGSIVNISSMASVVPSPGLASYGAAKAGLNQLTRTLAVEFGPKVRVNCIALGTIQTEALDEHIFGNDPERKRRYTEGVPLRRIGTPEEIANTCIFLASDRAPYVNGATIWADGGGVRGA
jgi:NAD(P)-dependent dehydrogenase (short-subunit alcohol dehydrogenase family)